MKNKVNYSNRQVQGEEHVFAPQDEDALLVGGVNQKDPFGYTSVVKPKPSNPQGDEDQSGAGDEEPSGTLVELNTDEEEEKLGSVNTVSFEQTGSFTGDGTYLANVTAIISDVKGATDYEIQFTKIS